MNITTKKVAGIDEALYGMRHPMNSWDKGDTKDGVIGPNDLKLAQTLITGGPEHAKFMRQIHVWADIDMPRYWWSEFDTYHFNTKNSCSTMHRLLHSSTVISKDLFFYNKEDEDIVEVIVKRLDEVRDLYLKAPTLRDKVILLRRAKQLLPEGFMQLRLVATNYAELRNVYFQRRNHKLQDEWRDTFCDWVDTLPYAAELITYTGKGNK